MMNDKQFLQWVWSRMYYMHGESPYSDYMHKLLAISNSLPDDHYTPNVAFGEFPLPPEKIADIKNQLEDLYRGPRQKQKLIGPIARFVLWLVAKWRAWRLTIKTLSMH